MKLLVGGRQSIENTEHSVSRHLVQAIKITGKSQSVPSTARMEHMRFRLSCGPITSETLQL